MEIAKNKLTTKTYYNNSTGINEYCTSCGDVQYHWSSTRFSGKMCRYQLYSGIDKMSLDVDPSDSGVDTFQ